MKEGSHRADIHISYSHKWQSSLGNMARELDLAIEIMMLLQLTLNLSGR